MILQKLDQIAALVAEIKAELAAQPPTKPVVLVKTESELVSALSNGDDIQIDPGIYTGNFVVNKPCQISGLGATLRALDPFTETLTINASDVTVSGLTVVLGMPDRTAVSVFGDRVTIDTCTIVAEQGGHRGIALYGSDNNVINSSIEGFWEVGRDSQAIWITGAGPCLIDNNYLEASGENILLGGGRFAPGVIPQDVTITNNTLFKDPAWKALNAQVKNSFEIKAGRRIRFANNLIDGNWQKAQVGTPIVITPRNQHGDNPWVEIADVIVEDNDVVNCPDGFAVNILGTDDIYTSLPSGKVTVRNNIFYTSPNGVQIVNPAGMTVEVTGNRFLGITGKFLSLGGPGSNLTLLFTNNITKQGAYGITGDGTTTGGLPTLDKMVSNLTFINNIIEKYPPRVIQLPPGNTWVDSIAGL